MKSVEPMDAETLNTTREEKTIYLIPALFDDKAIQEYLKDNFQKIFVTELNSWYTDESLWVQDVDYKTFCEWFNVEWVDIVYDMFV